MKIIYILKKGFQYYPPCLAQALYLNDLGVDLVIYHGNNSKYIDNLFDERKIEHHNYGSDADSKNKLESILNYGRYILASNKLVKKIDKDHILWFGNCESAIAVNEKNLEGRRYVLSILELYDEGTVYDKGLKKIIGNAERIICCEKHRAAIMQVRYHLKKLPDVLPNKPYENDDNLPEISSLSSEIQQKIEYIKNKKVVLYQGIVTPDRPLDNIARALNIINDGETVFAVMGKASEKMQKYIGGLYTNTVFMGFVPSPQHLCVTQFASVGIANYDYSCLNNMFCAPNKIYEYAKFGIPMLTSQNVGLVETAGEYKAAECVDFSSVEDVANGLRKILNNKNEYIGNAKKFYNDVDNKTLINKMVNALEARKENK